ncbi:hypothetical protein KKF70_02965 [bacterium]|nr:hypothetical protein [bacterium]
MKKIILILGCFIFAAQVYAKEGNKKETKQAPFDHEAYKAYEEGLMNSKTEEIIAGNLKIEKIFGDTVMYFKLFNKNTGEAIGEYEDIRVDISEDKNYSLIRPWGSHGYSGSEKVIFFDNENLKIVWEKRIKEFIEKYGRYSGGKSGISKNGDLVAIILGPKNLLESNVHDIVVLDKKGNIVEEMQYGHYLLGGVDDTLEFSPKLKLLIGKETRFPFNKVFSIEKGEHICDSEMISISNNEKYLAVLRRAPEFSEVGRTEEDSPGTFSSSEEERLEYLRILKVNTNNYKKEQLISDMDVSNAIEPYIYIYDTGTDEIIGNVRVPMKQPYRKKWGKAFSISSVKELEFSKDDKKIIVTTEYEGERKKQEFTIKEGIEFKKYQGRAFKKLKEKRLARQKEEKIPYQERDRRGRIKNLRKKVQEIRKTAKERGLEKTALKELKQIEKKIKDNSTGTTYVGIRAELAKFEVKYNLMGHVSYKMVNGI